MDLWFHQKMEGTNPMTTASTQDAAQEEHHTIDIVHDDLQWIKNLTTELNQRRQRTEGPWRCSIFKVPEDIRQLDPKAFEPAIVTIGPYHHATSSKDTPMLALQDHKWHCVRRLICRHTKSRRTATDLFYKCLLVMKERDTHVRSCYSEDLDHLSPHDLALIMLLDACFIIHLLLKFNEDGDLTKMLVLEEEEEEEEEEEDMAGEEGMVVLDAGREKQIDVRLAGMLRIWMIVLYDLVKLENQIPFAIVHTLFDMLKTPRDDGINLVEIAHRLLCHTYPSKNKSFTAAALPESHQVHHLLHLFHSTLIPSNECLKANASKPNIEYGWIPSATELQLAGVKFRKKEKNLTSFLDISFINGIIEIPQLCVDDHTNTLFRNLIAFEQCYPHTKDYISTYAMFMDNIINSAKDIELLGLNGIITNQLGTDDAVADLFNQLDKRIRHDPSKFYLWGTIWHAKNYYDSKWHQYRARLMRDYFNNPWAILSVVAAIILLLLTIQQSFFSAYSYFRPP
ncbi:hypothetical protein J5N97_010668 [Dioscorea zingiberensis]|uniref:Uncharacterized protein n=1 Tax=Dioscorea zingiberensis TaxID=325984 RepID=A0A9D5HMV9_9LILI|nr:hypothetical protein J5N97_010668 [Dioscorea zingiberensis]